MDPIRSMIDSAERSSLCDEGTDVRQFYLLKKKKKKTAAIIEYTSKDQIILCSYQKQQLIQKENLTHHLSLGSSPDLQ